MSRLAETADREAIFNLVREFEATHRGAKPFEPGKTVIPPSGKLIDADSDVHLGQWGRRVRALPTLDAADDGSEEAAHQ